jgi:hypothetical protein
MLTGYNASGKSNLLRSDVRPAPPFAAECHSPGGSMWSMKIPSIVRKANPYI